MDVGCGGGDVMWVIFAFYVPTCSTLLCLVHARRSVQDLVDSDAKYNDEMYICNHYDKLVFPSNHDASACMSCAKKRPNRVCQVCSNAVSCTCPTPSYLCLLIAMLDV
jgi:hypothetical protein